MPLGASSWPAALPHAVAVGSSCAAPMQAHWRSGWPSNVQKTRRAPVQRWFCNGAVVLLDAVESRDSQRRVPGTVERRDESGRWSGVAGASVLGASSVAGAVAMVLARCWGSPGKLSDGVQIRVLGRRRWGRLSGLEVEGRVDCVLRAGCVHARIVSAERNQ